MRSTTKAGSVAVALAALALGALPSGAVAGAATAQGAGVLTVELVSSPSAPRAGTPVHLTLRVHDTAAKGAFSYDLQFGDGTSAHNVVPMYCIAEGIARSGTWTFTHRYAVARTYVATVTVGANCTPGRATKRLAIRVG